MRIVINEYAINDPASMPCNDTTFIGCIITQGTYYNCEFLSCNFEDPAAITKIGCRHGFAYTDVKEAFRSALKLSRYKNLSQLCSEHSLNNSNISMYLSGKLSTSKSFRDACEIVGVKNLFGQYIFYTS